MCTLFGKRSILVGMGFKSFHPLFRFVRTINKQKIILSKLFGNDYENQIHFHKKIIGDDELKFTILIL